MVQDTSLPHQLHSLLGKVHEKHSPLNESIRIRFKDLCKRSYCLPSENEHLF